MNPFRICFGGLLPFLFRQPKVGDVYVHVAEDLNPFYPVQTRTVKEVRGQFILWRESTYGQESSVSVHELLTFYRLYEDSQS